MPKDFKGLIDSAERILITSHISPDPDAVSSVLLFGTTLQTNFPNKQLKMVLEERPARDLSFLQNYQEVEFRPVLEAVQDLKPDLFILLDAANFERCSRSEGQELRQQLAKLGSVIVIIDHHEEYGKDNADIYINNHKPATAQEIYELLFEKLSLKKSADFARTTLLGIISDTARHKFDNPDHRETYRVVSDLIDAGASIEELENKIDRYTINQLVVLANLLSHVTDSGKGYSYSYVDDQFTSRWLEAAKPKDDFKLGFEEFTQQYLRKIDDNLWGFAVYRDLMTNEVIYGVSLRSARGAKDVAAIANRLGGGGHKPAAGAKFKAENVEEAIKKVQAAIEADA